MIRLKIKNYNMILTEKRQRHRPYHQARLININILQRRNIIFQSKKIIEQAKFSDSLLGKVSQKQTRTIKDQGKKIAINKRLYFKEKTKS